jgi:hypothetical protein
MCRDGFPPVVPFLIYVHITNFQYQILFTGKNMVSSPNSYTAQFVRIKTHILTVNIDTHYRLAGHAEGRKIVCFGSSLTGGIDQNEIISQNICESSRVFLNQGI